MIALIQRVSEASISVDGEIRASMGPGLLALIGVTSGDESASTRRLLERMLGYRVFPDSDGRMNRALREHGGGLLLVPQFTLAADTRRGTRPGFSTAAEPARARQLFDELVGLARAAHPQVGCGEFGAHMQVRLLNDGPVTFWLES